MDRWVEQNRAYLSAVCEGLRLRLLWLIDGDAIASDAIATADEAVAAAAAIDPAPAALVLGDRFNLTDLEVGILLLCVALEVDPGLPSLCDQAQEARGWTYPTFGLCFRLFDQVDWDVMTVDAPLRYWRLLELHSPQPQPLPQTMLRADERIVNYAMGTGGLDYRLDGLVARVGGQHAGVLISASQRAMVASVCERLAATEREEPLPVVQLLGTSDATKVLVARAVAQEFGMRLYTLMVEVIPVGDAAFMDFLRLWERETILAGVALYIDTQELGAETPSRMALRRFLGACNGLMFVDSREVRLPPDRGALVQEIAKPTAVEQRRLWVEVLEDAALSAVLAGQFCLNLEEIEAIGLQRLKDRVQSSAGQRQARPGSSRDGEEESPALGGTDRSLEGQGHKTDGSVAYLWQACLERTQPRLESLAQRIDVKASWDDLVLPEEAMGVLGQIVDQVRLRGRVYDDLGFRVRMNRGLGVSAMFAGESGTGKTMAAEVIANELSLHLYRIDLSSVVSKYIGETEKNLRRLFDAAEEGGAILFFDEADALFGKRSDVKDSHDRYANVEINYLLQRIEAYRGLAILATNLRQALDQAFLRRLRFVVKFPFPSLKHRERMWRQVFPVGVASDEVDYEHLSRFDIAGGTIQTVALNAAFMASRKDELVGMTEILEAIRVEYGKLDRQIYEADFQWDGPGSGGMSWEGSW